MVPCISHAILFCSNFYYYDQHMAKWNSTVALVSLGNSKSARKHICQNPSPSNARGSSSPPGSRCRWTSWPRSRTGPRCGWSSSRPGPMPFMRCAQPFPSHRSPSLRSPRLWVPLRIGLFPFRTPPLWWLPFIDPRTPFWRPMPRWRVEGKLSLCSCLNDLLRQEYAELIQRSRPDFIEVKGVIFCGKTDPLNMENNVPTHQVRLGHLFWSLRVSDSFEFVKGFRLIAKSFVAPANVTVGFFSRRKSWISAGSSAPCRRWRSTTSWRASTSTPPARSSPTRSSRSTAAGTHGPRPLTSHRVPFFNAAERLLCLFPNFFFLKKLDWRCCLLCHLFDNTPKAIRCFHWNPSTLIRVSAWFALQKKRKKHESDFPAATKKLRQNQKR